MLAFLGTLSAAAELLFLALWLDVERTAVGTDGAELFGGEKLIGGGAA